MANNNKNNKANDENEKTVVDKYLTEMKELPPEKKEEVKKEEKEPEKQVVKKTMPEPVVKKEEVTKKQDKKKSKEPETDLAADDLGPSDTGKLPLSSKDIILGVVNLISVVALIFILTKFPQKSKELNALKLEQMKNESNVSLETGQIEIHKEKAQEMEELFLNQAGVVEFVNDVQSLEGEGSSIRNLTFANQEPIKDKTGNYGLPVIIEMEGSWEQISSDIQKIDQLPYLFRPASTIIERSEDNLNVIVFDYGIFLYVKDELGENR